MDLSQSSIADTPPALGIILNCKLNRPVHGHPCRSTSPYRQLKALVINEITSSKKSTMTFSKTRFGARRAQTEPTTERRPDDRCVTGKNRGDRGAQSGPGSASSSRSCQSAIDSSGYSSNVRSPSCWCTGTHDAFGGEHQVRVLGCHRQLGVDDRCKRMQQLRPARVPYPQAGSAAFAEAAL